MMRLGLGTGLTGLAGLSGAVGGSFVPTDLADLKLWLKADGVLWQDSGRTTRALVDGDRVGAWDDGSGTNNHATQGADARRGTLKLNVQNGKPAVRFDGTDDVLVTPNANGTAQTLFVVCKYISGNGSAVCGFHDSSAMLGVFGGSYYWQWREGGGYPTFGAAGTSAALLTLRFNSAASCDVYRSGTFNQTFDPNDTFMNKVLDVGGLSAGNYGNYDVFELLLYGAALADASRLKVEGYLNARWALS